MIATFPTYSMDDRQFSTVLQQGPIHHFSFYALSDSVTSQCLYLLSFLSLSLSLSLSLALINSLILFLKLTKPASLVLYPQNAGVNLDLILFYLLGCGFFFIIILKK
jgi:hypothetical protein